MAGLFGFLAAGAAKGAGDGIVAEARAKREAAIAELENSRLMQREQMDRDFRSSEADKQRSFDASESSKTRAASAEQSRMGRLDSFTAEDGSMMVRDGTKASPVLGADGKPIKGLVGGKGDQPAEVKTAQWLMKEGIASTPADAYKMATSAKEKGVTPADIERMTENAVKTEIGSNPMIRPTPDQIQESRSRNRARILKGLGIDDTPAQPSAGGDGGGPSKADIIEQAKAAIAAGASADAVKSRMQSMGLDPSEAGL